MNRNAIRVCLLLSLLVAIGAAPFLARGDQQVRAIREQSAKAIAQLPESARDRLMRNFQEYQGMTAAQRAQMLALHQAIEKDRIEGRGELAAVMNQYDAWLKTIEPYQRDELYKTTDPAKRLALMREILRKQREQTAERAMRGTAPPWGRGGPEGRRMGMDSESLAKVMAAIEDRARHRLTEEQLKQLQSQQGLKRYVTLLQFLKDADLNHRPLIESPPPEFASVTEDFAQFVGDSRLREWMFSSANPAPRPVRLAWMLQAALLMELFKQRAVAENPISQAALEEYFKQLPADEQNELLALEASDFRTDLRNHYLDAHGLAGLPDREQLAQLFRGNVRDFGPGFGRDGMGRGERLDGDRFDRFRPGEEDPSRMGPGDGNRPSPFNPGRRPQEGNGFGGDRFPRRPGEPGFGPRPSGEERAGPPSGEPRPTPPREGKPNPPDEPHPGETKRSRPENGANPGVPAP